MCTLSALLLLTALLVNPATFISLPDLIHSYEKHTNNSQRDVHHRQQHEGQRLNERSDLQEVQHCSGGKNTFELKLAVDEGSRSEPKMLKEERPEDTLKRTTGQEETMSVDRLKVWYKRMGLH